MCCCCVFTWQASTDRDDTQQHRGEQQQQHRGPALASVPRAGEQQHPRGLLGDGEPQTGTEVAVIPPSLWFYDCIFLLVVLGVFFRRESVSADYTQR